MINNASLKKIGELLNGAESILIFPHESPDGDAVGSCAALCRAMRDAGKEAWILLDEDVPKYLQFMDTEYCTTDQECIASPDLCVCIDCSEETRFRKRADVFNKGKTKICLDHHATSAGFGDYHYIDGSEAASAQIIYKLLKEMGVRIDSRLAESLYVGISTDTGSFQHSNTTAETHAITSELFRAGLELTDIVVSLYHSVSYRRLRLESRVLDRMELSEDGKVAISFITKDLLEEENASSEDVDGMIDLLRNIEGVELAALLKEKDGEIKVSMRAKSYGRVDNIAVKYGGGGHAKAAGCTLHMSMEEAAAVIREELKNNREN